MHTQNKTDAALARELTDAELALATGGGIIMEGAVAMAWPPGPTVMYPPGPSIVGPDI